MVDNDILKAKVSKELKQLKLSAEQEDVVVKELNYLADLLIDIYLKETKKGNKKIL